jgi:hypothetical protein
MTTGPRPMLLNNIVKAAQRQALHVRRVMPPPRFRQLYSSSRGGEAREARLAVCFSPPVEPSASACWAAFCLCNSFIKTLFRKWFSYFTLTPVAKAVIDLSLSERS